MAAAISQRNPSMRIGFAVNVVPLEHPIRFVTRCNLLDQLTAGKLIVGIGPGNAPDEFAGYGVDITRRHERMSEFMEVWRPRVVRGSWGLRLPGLPLPGRGAWPRHPGARAETSPAHRLRLLRSRPARDGGAARLVAAARAGRGGRVGAAVGSLPRRTRGRLSERGGRRPRPRSRRHERAPSDLRRRGRRGLAALDRRSHRCLRPQERRGERRRGRGGPLAVTVLRLA